MTGVEKTVGVDGVATVGTQRRPVQRHPHRPDVAELDEVVVEEPLQITLAWPGGEQKLAVTMRTPGSDRDLALGFLFGEGIIGPATDIIDVLESMPAEEGCEVVVRLAGSPVLLPEQRQTYMTSSCGVCGKAALAAVRVQSVYAPDRDGFVVAAATLMGLPGQLARGQALFAETGSIHAAALFTDEGELGRVFEDVGRHNAVDKLVGAALRAGALPLRACGVLVSGRASFELVQKASMAGIPLLAAVGAPSSLAIDLAWECGMTLVGFLRDGRCNVYSEPGRISDLS